MSVFVSAPPVRYRDLVHTPLFDIARTVKTYRLHFTEHADVLEELLTSVDRCLDRALPPEISARVDREGCTLEHGVEGQLRVRRHPALEQARQALAELGLFRVFLPEDVGGFGLPLALYFLSVQQVSTHDTSLALIFLVHGNAMYGIHRYGSEAQRRRYLPALASGEKLATVAFTEPLAGSDAGLIRTRARREGEEWVLTGEKLFITNGGDADVLITTARTGPLSDEIAGVSAFILEREADGVEVVGLEDKTGLAGSPTAALSYNKVRIPADRLLHGEGRGGVVMFAGVGMTRVNIAAQALGIAKRALAGAVAFAEQRVQGGRRILEHDAILERLAGVVSTVSAMENLICLDSALEEQGAWHVLEMSICKYHASEALQPLTSQAMAVLGGYAVCREYGVERCRREAVALPLYGGTSEIQWYIISRELLGVLDGSSRVDYRARGEARCQALGARAGEQGAPLARRVSVGHDRLWAAVGQVAAAEDQVPLYHSLTELAVAATVAQALLWQGTDEGAEDLERLLAARAVEKMERALDFHVPIIEGGDPDAGLKALLLRRLG